MRGIARTRTIAAVVALTVVVLVPQDAAAARMQAATATLHGTIGGNDGSVPLGARLEVRSRETSVARVVPVDADGAYRVLGLAPGIYDVHVRALGYRQQRREHVRLVVGQRATLDFTLERGAVELEPTRISGHQAFEVQRTDVSTAVLQEEIERLPLNSRNVLNLGGIAPGIRTFAPEGGQSVPAAGALPVAEPRFSNLYVDGVEWKGTYIGSVVGEPQKGSPIPQEAVREFRVSLNPYDAELARGASHVVSVVTHQGGNAFEGSLIGFFQNKPLVARATYQAREPEYRRYQAGGSLRGPLVRDRLFFAASYEGQTADNFVDVVPGRPPANAGIWDRYAGTFEVPSRIHTGLLRLTAPLRSHSLDAIWATRQVASQSGVGTRRAGVMLSHDAGVGGTSRVNSLQLRDTYASASLVNELSIHFLEVTNHQSPLRPGPTLVYPGIQIGRFEFPVLVADRHLRAINRTSYTRTGPTGQHVLKAGVEVTRARTFVHRPSNKDGAFDFATDTSTLPFRGVIAMDVSDPTSTDAARVAIDGWFAGAYLQDEWQPVSRLTVTAGLRWDADVNTLNQRFRAPWARDTTLVRAIGEEFLNTGDRENDLDNFAPRFAASWDATGAGRTFLRAGYGRMYDRIPVFGAANERIAAGWRTYVFPSPGTSDPAELRRRVLAGEGASPASIVLMKDRLETPSTRQWSAGIGHRVADGLALNVDYLMQRVTNAYVSVTTNQAVDGRRPITDRHGDITLWDDFGDARFRGLLASVTYDRQPTRLNLAYTLGWAESEFGQFTTSGYPDSAAYVMQRSETDERHRVVVSGMTELPLRFGLSAVAIAASPRPFLVTVGDDLNRNGSRVDDWPDGSRTHRRHGWGHWYRTVDLRLSRSFRAPGGSVSVSAEVFNVFSWANHAEYQAVQSSLQYGEPISDYARRQAQVGVRYRF